MNTTRTRPAKATTPAPSPHSRRRWIVLGALVLAACLIGAFALGRVTAPEPASNVVTIERDMAATVLMLNEDESAIVLDTAEGSKSYLLLGEAPAVGETAQGTLVLLRSDDGSTVEGFIPRP